MGQVEEHAEASADKKGLTGEERERYIGGAFNRARHGNKRFTFGRKAREETKGREITLYRRGDFYEAYGDEADELERATGLQPRTIGGRRQNIFPHQTKELYTKRAKEQGYTIRYKG